MTKNSWELSWEYNPNKKRKILILFHDTSADMLSNKKSLSNSDFNQYQHSIL